MYADILKGAVCNFLCAYKQTKRQLFIREIEVWNMSFRCILKPYVYMFYLGLIIKKKKKTKKNSPLNMK